MSSPRFRVLRSVAQDLVGRLSAMPDEELRKLIRSCRRLTGTNCWWLIYDLEQELVAAVASVGEPDWMKGEG